MIAPATPSERNTGIDYLRGFAILMVVIHHMALGFRLPLGHSLLGQLIGKRLSDAISFNGYESVFVFFVLSGFLITQRILQAYGGVEHLDWRRFYRQRAIRILPLLYLLLAVLSVLHWLYVPDYRVEENGQTLGHALFSAVGLHLNWYEGQTGWLPASWDVLWSLSIEEVFYLGFPLICLLPIGRLRWVLLLALAISLPWTHAAAAGNEIWQEKAYLPGMSAIAWGVLTAVLAQRWQPSRATAVLFAVVGAVGVADIYVFGDSLSRVVHQGYLQVLCLSACLLVLSAHVLQPVARRSLGWLASMGRLSYEIYLSHAFVVLTVNRLYHALLGKDLRWTFLVYVPTIVVCFYLGKLLERHVSQRCALWLRSNRLGASLATQGT